MKQHILVGVNNNIQEWNDSLKVSLDRPRLPLPYMFGAAFYKRGHRLSAINHNAILSTEKGEPIFEKVYVRKELGKAMKQVNLALLWAAMGISAISQQVLACSRSRNVFLASYVWELKHMPDIKKKVLSLTTQMAARHSRGLVVMTSEQKEQARETLPSALPIIKGTIGIDVSFYKAAANINDVSKERLADVQKILLSPYVIMLGDEQRLNEDALDIAQETSMTFVRVCQYANSQKRAWLQSEIERRALQNRFFVFEKVDNLFLRFLLQHASAYAGLVDATWQPAGWTAACEALASGLPLVLYEGLVSRELKNLGAEHFIQRIEMKDKKSFRLALESFSNDQKNSTAREARRSFAADKLNLETTGIDFVEEIESFFEIL